MKAVTQTDREKDIVGVVMFAPNEFDVADEAHWLRLLDMKLENMRASLIAQRERVLHGE